MVGRKLVFDNESLPDTYNESPLPQSPDANELFAQWDSPMQSPSAVDVQDSGHYDRWFLITSRFFDFLWHDEKLVLATKGTSSYLQYS